MDVAALVDLARTSVLRLVRGNFQKTPAMWDERRVLTSVTVPIRDAASQDYLAWRRSALWVSAVAMSIWVVVALVSYEGLESKFREEYFKSRLSLVQAELRSQDVKFGEPRREHAEQAINKQADEIVKQANPANLQVIDGVVIVLEMTILAGVVMLVMAARSWSRFKRSRRYTYMTFCIVFAVPFLLAMVPFATFMDSGDVDSTNRKVLNGLFGSHIGAILLLVIGPRALALYPAAIRAAMSLRTLVPESPLPGWAVVLLAPACPLLLVLAISLFSQGSGDLVLFGGMACFMIGPLLYVVNAASVVRPATPDGVVAQLAPVRSNVLLFNALGTVLLVIFMMQSDLFGGVQLFRFIAGFVGNYFLVMVVSSDMLLGLIDSAHRQAKDFAGSEFEQSLESRLEGLRGTGLTELPRPR